MEPRRSTRCSTEYGANHDQINRDLMASGALDECRNALARSRPTDGASK